ncbi:MAG: TetR family transcriptional regulator [Cryobacterium sp.]|nr:TetR family transcriptional regulator [Cryobacterium sp.]MCC7128043.1 TetR family transcriptional regulator [Microbacteriaceae bacterium]MCO5294007.1 TetR family transcriptional regulator [Homoserinimonas sp.]MBX3090615.1 TetR family transcriptional regulator [Cryobacterium sp.]MBX3116246.1 TetR family transcriptional regulator [Cryobacterium sp.]
MRIVESFPEHDLTARARLRNAAIEIFAASGFNASVRDIATHAGVSAGLITHHFGSKENLRHECDLEVVRQYREIKSNGVAMTPTQSIAIISETNEYAPMLVYILRSVKDGGLAGREILEHMIEEAIVFSEEGVATGVVRPSRDPASRARYLVTSGLGGILLQLSLRAELDIGKLDLSEIGPIVRGIVDDVTLPTLEVYTEGVLADGAYLDEYLRVAANQNGQPAPRSETERKK